jgi:hypothetical protein
VPTGDPQREGIAKHALVRIEQELRSLATVGLVLELVRGNQVETALKFPQMLYKGNLPELVVETSEELGEALADGWREHPSLNGAPFVTSAMPVEPAPLAPVPVFSMDLSGAIAQVQGG